MRCCSLIAIQQETQSQQDLNTNLNLQNSLNIMTQNQQLTDKNLTTNKDDQNKPEVVYKKFRNLRLFYEPIEFLKIINANKDNHINQQIDHETKNTNNGVKIYEFPEGMQVILVEEISKVDEAVQKLRNEAKDNLISVDYEWLADGFFKDVRFHKIALIQIASHKLCVLFRVCKWNFEMPESIRNLLCDPKFVILVQNPQSNDENKMQLTFQMGRKDYHSYINFAQLLQSLGYAKASVRSICQNLWGSTISNKVFMSNWEKNELSLRNIHYAALDVFAMGTAVRYLWLQLKQGQKCLECQRVLGIKIDINCEVKDTCSGCHRKIIVEKEEIVDLQKDVKICNDSQQTVEQVKEEIADDHSINK